MSQILFAANERLILPNAAAKHLIALHAACEAVLQEMDSDEIDEQEAISNRASELDPAIIEDLRRVDLGNEAFQCAAPLELSINDDPLASDNVPEGCALVLLAAEDCQSLDLFAVVLAATMRRFEIEGFQILHWISVCMKGRSHPGFGVIVVSSQGLTESWTSQIAEMTIEKARSDVDRAVQINMAEHFEYDEPNTPEWAWIEKNACFQHTGNGEMGVWEFIVHESKLGDEDMPSTLRDIIKAKVPPGACYAVFHQGT